MQLLRVISSFTLAHSVTLALAAFDVVRPPATIVEPVIALSIVFVGINTLYLKEHSPDRRIVFAFCFGLIHGFGFANALREMQLPTEALAWSLVSFNLGVEAGQACIVLAIAPALALLHRWRPAIAHRTVLAASSFVIFAGAYWFLERVFG